MKNDLCIWLHRWFIKMCLVFGFQMTKIQWNQKQRKNTYNRNVTLFPFRRKDNRREENKESFWIRIKFWKFENGLSASGPGWRLRVIVFFNSNPVITGCWMFNMMVTVLIFIIHFNFYCYFLDALFRSLLFTLRRDPCRW